MLVNTTLVSSGELEFISSTYFWNNELPSLSTSDSELTTAFSSFKSIPLLLKYCRDNANISASLASISLKASSFTT